MGLLEQAFLDDILDRPDDDAPRLVYADWLDENGDAARAELIRVQCRLASLGDGHPDGAALERSAGALLDEHGERWAEPLRGMVSEWAFRRGLIDHVKLDGLAGQSLDGLPRLFGLAPVQSLTLEDFADQGGLFPALLRLGEPLRRLRYLELVNWGGAVTTREMKAFFTSPLVGGLRTLYLDHSEVDEVPSRGLAALAASPALASLEDVALAIGDVAGEMSSSAVRALSRSTCLRLRRLYLTFIDLTRPALRELAGSPALPLEVLWLQACEVPHRAWEELLRPGALPHLKQLALRRAYPDNNTLRSLRERFGTDAVLFEERDSADTYFPRRQARGWSSS